MTVAEIASLASSLLGVTVTPDQAIPWINDFLKKHAGELGNETETTVTASAPRAWCNLPADCVRVVKVARDGDDYTYWETRPGAIRFGDSGTFEVTYERMPNSVSLQGDTPDCPALFHSAIGYYVAYRIEAVDFPADQETQARRAEYLERFNDAKSTLKKKPRAVKAGYWV